ncbi:MAG: hypothetical protein HY652_05420 [Acidobacteria bacterium]|nr:hypothetical protein [Acidobacteriota bacterium]
MKQKRLLRVAVTLLFACGKLTARDRPAQERLPLLQWIPTLRTNFNF